MDEFDKARVELLRERIAMLQERIRLRDTQIEILREDLDKLKVIASNRPTPSPVPLYLSETQEDVMHARDAEQISIAEAEDILRELDFENSVVVLDEPDNDLTLY